MRWTGNQAKFAALICFCAALLECSKRQPPIVAGQLTVGMVRDALGLELYDTPGGSLKKTVSGNLALRVESRSVQGLVWNRLITSDGLHGWTSVPLRSLVAVQVLTIPHVLMNKSPDDDDFSEATEIQISSDVKGNLLGASNKARIASTKSLMVPERLRRNQLPWLAVKFDSRTGYVPLDWVILSWQSGSDGTLDSFMDASGARGIIWRPFLGPVAARLMDLAPLKGSSSRVVDRGTMAAKQEPLPEQWDGIDMIYRDGSALLVVFSLGPARLFRFLKSDVVTADLFVPGEEAYPATVLHTDINGDGTLDWILEVVSTYGDGYYSTLWILDGTSAPDTVKTAQIQLSRSSGEQGADIDAIWETAADGTIQISRATRQGRNLRRYRYTDHLAELHE